VTRHSTQQPAEAGTASPGSLAHPERVSLHIQVKKGTAALRAAERGTPPGATPCRGRRRPPGPPRTRRIPARTDTAPTPASDPPASTPPRWGIPSSYDTEPPSNRRTPPHGGLTPGDRKSQGWLSFPNGRKHPIRKAPPHRQKSESCLWRLLPRSLQPSGNPLEVLYSGEAGLCRPLDAGRVCAEAVGSLGVLLTRRSDLCPRSVDSPSAQDAKPEGTLHLRQRSIVGSHPTRVETRDSL
jgi:hypothetical protein